MDLGPIERPAVSSACCAGKDSAARSLDGAERLSRATRDFVAGPTGASSRREEFIKYFNIIVVLENNGR